MPNPGGASYSQDRGRTWEPLNQSGYHALGITGKGNGWAVGDKGKIAKFTIR